MKKNVYVLVAILTVTALIFNVTSGAVGGMRRGQATQQLDNTLDIKITGKYIIFPISSSGQRGQVSNRGQRSRMSLTVEGQLVHNLDCDFPRSKDAIDWWGWLDMSEYVGKTARIASNVSPEILGLVESSDQIRNIMPLYDEPLRPQFHMSQMRGWNNDGNGMCYYNGEYHFFWQCNPAGTQWANMYWGHAISTDMIHWTELKHALRPNGGSTVNRHPSMAVGNCFSGSGNVDVLNTAGWQQGNEKTMVLAFTDTGNGESLAYSTDRGRTWKYYEGNPVIKHSGRDPKLIWYEPGKYWVIALFDQRSPYGQNISIYTSKDLKQWEYASSIPGYFECAEILELPVDGNQANKKWVIFAADARYAIGNFDGKQFTPEHEGKYQVHWGSYYASQCFSNSPDGRAVQIGWARIEIPGMPFNQTFTVPTNLTLHTTDDGIRMFATPIKELDKLRKPEPKTTINKELTAESPEVKFNVQDQLFDIVLTLRRGTATKAILRFGENEAIYDFVTQRLDEMPLKMQDGKVTFRVLVDRPMYELIGGGGANYKTSGRKDMGKSLSIISLTVEGGSATAESIVIYAMESVWKK
jgi:fructan beta-fructosidase